jgi:peroxiredoxin (alkyl hydroperoxide reductase subunit C)
MPNLVANPAPEFQTTGVQNGEFKPIKLADYRGKWTLLFFYPLDFTFVCPTELLALSEHYDEFKKLGVEVFGCSVDSKFSHLNWMKQEVKDGGIKGVKYTLLEDLGGRIADLYGVLNGTVALRAMFLIDPEGIVQHSTINNLSVGRSIEETIRIVQAFQFVSTHSGEVCPMDWKPGAATMNPTEEGKRKYFEKTLVGSR